MQGIFTLPCMKIDGIKFLCKVNIIQAAASDIPHLFHIFVVLVNCHQAGDAALYRTFINNVRMI